MRKKISQLMKRSLVLLTALAMGIGCLPVGVVPARAAELETSPVTNYASRFSGEIVLENTGGDNLVLLQPLSAEDEFVFGADVTFTNLDEQQSAALIFGVKDNMLDDGHAIKANIHNRIDWNVPARVWGYGTGELKCPGENGQANTFFAENKIDVTRKFHMEVAVQKNDEGKYELTYWITNTDGEQVLVAEGILNDSYTGGRFGLMTYSSRAVFSNITVNDQRYGALESADGQRTLYGVNGDAHIVSDVKLEGGQAFTYETDMDLAADTCSAALTFGIQNRDNPGEAWIGANFNFNDYNGAGGARVFKVQNGSMDIGSASLDGRLNRSRTIHAKLQVSSEGFVTYELYNTDNAENKVTVTGTISDYQGGYLGLLTFDSSAVFYNTTYTVEAAPEAPTEPKDTEPSGTLPEGSEPEETEPTDDDGIPDSFGVRVENGIYILDNCYGYVFEIDDVNGIIDGEDTTLINNASAYESCNPGQAVSVQLRPNGNDNGYSVMKVVECPGSAAEAGISLKEGDVILVVHSAASCPGDYENWLSRIAAAALKKGDIIELASDNATAAVIGPGEVLPDESCYNTNLGELTYEGGDGIWTFTEKGLYSDATGKGDCFAFSQVQGTNFVYATDLDFDGTEGAAALVFRSNQDLGYHESYAVNIDVGSHTCKFWKWQEGEALQLMDIKSVPATADETYTLKVVAYDSWVLYYVNDQLIASTGDYVLQPGNLGQDTVLKEGFFGILNWNSKVTFQNTYYKELSGAFNPLLTDISVTSSVGTVEAKTQFTPTEPITLQYVKNNASNVNIQVTRASEDAVVEIRDRNGRVYQDGKNIPVNPGSNYITVTSTVTAADGTAATMTYRVNVHRFKADSVYYNEAYRNQYHYSVKEGWANDPNGLVYYNGTYHMFYQFYDDTVWGPMHWAHATSTDLIHWEEQPIALYPDANGAMFSGCIVVDATNTSGFFDGIPGGGLVALITADGNGQRIKLAYSTDEGKTWTKVDEIAADWTDDPLRDAAFRDPKVFRWEGKWFMVVAGGPLRIYSSDDLRTWECEATYADLHTECPDLYPIQAPDGQIKWVLSRGGRFYKVGDFKTVDGSWRFVPDADYVSSDGVMNFGRDFYAAMTYYVQDFGTAASPNLPQLVELNWMNTWDDYCNQVADKVGQDFNGTFNLNLKLGLKKDGGKYVLTQTPINGYQSLRDTAGKQAWAQVTVEPNNALLKDFVGDTYEIIAKFYPEAGTTKVGFKVRTGEGEETRIVYDLETQNLSIDRSRSGVIISGKFAEVTSQQVTANADGTVDLHIYVDKASVEVFTKDYTAAGAAQIFPSPLSVGAEVLVEGAAAKADITLYPLESIWTDKVEVTQPQHIGTTSATTQNLYVGDSVKLNAYVLPTSVSQELTWFVKEGADVAEVDAAGTVTALQKGTAVVVAASKANYELTKEFTILVTENNFQTNLSGFVAVNGNWHIDDETLSVSNGGQNDYYMSAEAVGGDFTLETDICYTRGLINLFLASEGQNPHVGVGAYTIQFGYDTNVRLFPFGYADIATGRMENTINDGAYHRVKVIKEGMTITVYVDDAKCLEHTFAQTEPFFHNGHVGIGLWDGALDVQNFFVYPAAAPQPPLEGIVLESFCIPQDYLMLNVGETLPLSVEVQSAELGAYITWTVEEGGENVISIKNGTVTALAEGTAYVIGSVSDGKTTLTDRCRIDVAAPIELEGIQLSTTKLTTELYSTDYARFDILLKLPQNFAAAASATAAAPENKSVAITNARFENPDLAELFDLVTLDDRTVAVVPTEAALADAKAVQGKYISAVTVAVQGKEYITEETVTLTVKKTLPKLKATIPAFNNFWSGQTQEITVTGATVTGISCDNLPDWLSLYAGDLSLTEAVPAKGGSAKLTLQVETEEWAVPVETTLTVKCSYKAPGLKLSASSIQLAGRNSDGVQLQLQSKDKKLTLSDLGVSGITAPEGYSISNYNAEDGTFTIKAESGFQPGKINLTVSFLNTAEEVAVPLTVKATPVTLKLAPSSVTLNSGTGDSAAVTVTAAPADYRLTAPDIRIVDAAKQDKTDSGELKLRYENGRLSISTTEITPDNARYTLYISAEGGKEAALKISTTNAEPTLKLKTGGNLDLSFPGRKISLTTTFKNHAGGLSRKLIAEGESPIAYKVMETIGKDEPTEKTDAFILTKEGSNLFLSLRDTAGINIKNTYTLYLTLTLEDGSTLESSVKIPVKQTAVNLKLSANKLTLNKAINDKAAVTVTCTTKDYSFTQPVWQLLDSKGKASAEGKLDIAWIDNALVIAVNENTEFGTGYKLLVSAEAGAKATTLTVTIPAEAKSKVTGTLKATGNLDVIRDGTALTITPTWKNCNDAERTETLTIRNGSGEDVTNRFAFTEEDGKYTLTRGEELDHTQKYTAILTADFGNGITAAASTALKLKMGSAKLTVDAGSTTLFANDIRSRVNISFASTDSTLNGVTKVTLDPKLADQYELFDYGNGQYAIGFKDGTVPSKITSATISLNVWLEGNETAKANATLKVKLSIVR